MPLRVPDRIENDRHENDNEPLVVFPVGDYGNEQGSGQAEDQGGRMD